MSKPHWREEILKLRQCDPRRNGDDVEQVKDLIPIAKKLGFDAAVELLEEVVKIQLHIIRKIPHDS